MGGIAEGIHDGGKVVGYLRTELNDVGLGDGDILCKAAILAHDADGDGVLAYVAHASAAVTTMTADDMSLGRDAFADAEVAHTLPYFYHFAHELMAHSIWRTAVGLGPGVPLVHMQVGTAYSSFLDLDKYIVDTHLRHRHLFHPDTGFGKSLD
jgi:hypothetical protein